MILSEQKFLVCTDFCYPWYSTAHVLRNARAPLILIPKNTKTCLAKQDQAVWIYVIKNLNRECNFEIVNKLNINSVISFVNRVFEMYVTVNNRPIQDYVHQDESYSNLLMK